MVKRLRWIAAGVSVMLAAAAGARAQNSTAEVFGGYSYSKLNPEGTDKQSAHGWMAGAGGYANKWVGAGFEVAAGFGSIPAPGGAPSVSFKEYSYMAGPQVRFFSTAKAQAGVKILLGGVFGQVRLDSSTSPAQAQAIAAAGISNFDSTKFALLLAFPVDVSVTRVIGLRVEPGLFRTSFVNGHQSNFRFSVGPVFRFGSH
jgi:hypothetical protein